MVINHKHKAAIASVRNKSKAKRTMAFAVAGIGCEVPKPFYEAIQNQIDGLRRALEFIAAYPTLNFLDPEFVASLTPEERSLAKQCVWHILLIAAEADASSSWGAANGLHSSMASATDIDAFPYSSSQSLPSLRL